jgi:hypothetical protein
LQLKTKPRRGSAIPKKHDSLGSIRRFNNLPLPAGAGVRHPEATPKRSREPLFNDQADFPQKNAAAQKIPLDIASYKLYYVN